MDRIKKQQQEIQMNSLNLQDKERLLQMKEHYFQQELSSKDEQIRQSRHELKEQENIIIEIQMNSLNLQDKERLLQVKEHYFQQELSSKDEQIRQSRHELKEQENIIIANLMQDNVSV